NRRHSLESTIQRHQIQSAGHKQQSQGRKQNKRVVLPMVLTFDTQIFQRDCNPQSRGNQKYKLEKDREGIQGKDTAVGGEIGVSEPEQKQAGNRNPRQRNEPQLTLVWNQQ